jgi:hypothetical protein
MNVIQTTELHSSIGATRYRSGAVPLVSEALVLKPHNRIRVENLTPTYYRRSLVSTRYGG